MVEGVSVVSDKVTDGVVVTIVAVDIGVVFANTVGGLVSVNCMSSTGVYVGGSGGLSVASPLYVVSPVRHVVAVAPPSPTLGLASRRGLTRLVPRSL